MTTEEEKKTKRNRVRQNRFKILSKEKILDLITILNNEI